MQLPDPEQLIRQLAEQVKPLVTPNTALVGMYTGGVWIAEKIHEYLGGDLPVGTLDVSLYRDDFKHIGLHPDVKPSDIPFEVEGSDIILVDDVLYTGRSVRAAMQEIFDYGRPASIKLVVLIDRGGRELPIEPQLAGQVLPIEKEQNIQLERDESGKLTLGLYSVQEN